MVVVAPVGAQRKPVLPQIDEPHPYYYRELYLPQLTSGPSSLCWGPDSEELIYSMAGTLWRQSLRSRDAKQLTDGAGIRLSAGLVAGWEVGGVCVVSEGCDGIVDFGFGEWEDTCLDQRRGSECGAAMVSGWEENCLDRDGVQPAISYFFGRCSGWGIEK